VLAGGEDHLAERYHAHFADCVADDGKCLLSDLAIRRDIVGVAKVKIVDLRPRNKLLDVDGAFAFYGNSFELIRGKLDILILGDFVAFNDIGLIDVLAGLGIDLSIADAVPGFFVELVEADLFALGGRRIKSDRTRDKRKFEVAFPIRTRATAILLRTGTI
jgi:hypothetical protein